MKDIDKRRQRKLNKALEGRYLLRLWRKQEALWKGARACNIVELEKPIRKGYHRFFILREDIARSKESAIYKPLLKWINNFTRCHDKNFLFKPFGSKIKKPITQEISFISHKKWKEFEKISTLKQQSMFDKIWHQDYHKGRPIGGEWRFHFNKPWMFVYKIEPYYITHKVLINPQLESETAELWNRIWSEGKYYKIGKLLGWRLGRDRRMEWENRRSKMILSALEKQKKDDLHVHENGGDYYDIYD